MGIIKRIKNLFRVEANSLLDSLEDPIKSIELDIEDKKVWIRRTKLELAKVIAYSKELDMKAKVAQEEVDQLDLEIKKILENKDEDRARLLISSKLAKEKNIKYFKETSLGLNEKANKEFVSEINKAVVEIVSAEATLTGLRAELSTVQLANNIAKDRSGLSNQAIDVDKLKSKINSIRYTTEGISEVAKLTGGENIPNDNSLDIEAELFKYKEGK